jgi:hypothetical protein
MRNAGEAHKRRQQWSPMPASHGMHHDSNEWRQPGVPEARAQKLKQPGVSAAQNDLAQQVEKMIQHAAQPAAATQLQAKLNARLAQNIIEACAAVAPTEKPTDIAEAILKDLGAAGGDANGGSICGQGAV